jgi:hypothetical protein
MNVRLKHLSSVVRQGVFAELKIFNSQFSILNCLILEAAGATRIPKFHVPLAA